jgi:hypothetical protein
MPYFPSIVVQSDNACIGRAKEIEEELRAIASAKQCRDFRCVVDSEKYTVRFEFEAPDRTVGDQVMDAITKNIHILSSMFPQEQEQAELKRLTQAFAHQRAQLADAYGEDKWVVFVDNRVLGPFANDHDALQSIDMDALAFISQLAYRPSCQRSDLLV